MSSHLLGASPEQRKTLEGFHGLGQSRSASRAEEEDVTRRRPRVPISVPRDGSRPDEPSSSRTTYKSGTRPSHYRSKNIPDHPTRFTDNLHDNFHDAGSSRTASLGTARRSTSRYSRPQRTSPTSPRRTPPGLSPEVSVDISAPANLAKGKGRALDGSPRRTRANSKRKASIQDAINLDSDDDDDIPKAAPGLSSSRDVELAIKAIPTSTALQKKEQRARREVDVAVHSVMKAAVPDSFYSRTNQASGSRSRLQRPQGPIPLEEPNVPRKTNAGSAILVRDSPEPEVQDVSPPKLDRKSHAKTQTKIVDRMKGKTSSSVASNAAERRPSRGVKTRHILSPSLSPQPRSSPDPGPSKHIRDSNATFGPNKRMRTDFGSAPSRDDSAYADPPDALMKVPLKSIVVSDFWRSRDGDDCLALFNVYSLSFGVKPDDMIKISYSDIQRVVASKQEVRECGTLCFSLKPGSGSAKTLQDKFRDFDPHASDAADEIQLIAQHDSLAESIAHKKAISRVVGKVKESLDQSRIQWLNEANAKTKVAIVRSVKQADWPSSSSIPARQPRTLIRPGDGRPPEPQIRRDTYRLSTFDLPRPPKKKAFDIQPESPEAATAKPVDVDMRDAFPSSSSPPLLPLSIPRAKLAGPLAPKVEIRRPKVSSDGIILQYPPEDLCLTIRDADFDRLLDDGFLNDIVIEFGTKYILRQIRTRNPDLADSIYVFSSFFTTKLLAGTVEQTYSSMRRWVKDDIFSKKYVVIPINEHLHWYLAIIVNPGYLLMDHSKDSNSEQDKEEVASALALPTEASSRRAPPRDMVPSKAGEQHHDEDAAGSSEPCTPPLPSRHLPSPSAKGDAASLHTAMDVDAKSRANTPARPERDAADPDHMYIITLDSLGQRHVKTTNKIYEFLWRKAWDKKKGDAAKQSTPVKDDKEQLKTQQEDVKADTRSKETADPQPAGSAGNQSSKRAQEDARELAAETTTEASGKINGSRTLPVQEKRQAVLDAVTNSKEAEAWSKTFPKAEYIKGEVPEQPNFCDCGIYLLHYIDRFFRAPEHMLNLVVEAKDRLATVNKAGPPKRKQTQREVADRVEAEWQAGEVSSKRAFWRTKLVELSEEWEASQEKRADKEADEADEKDLQVQDLEHSKQAANGTSQQKQLQSQSQPPPAQEDGDVPMPHAQRENSATAEPPGLDANDMSSFERTLHRSDEGNASIDEIERSVHDCALGKDPDADRAVANILAQAHAKASGAAPLPRGDTQELRDEGSKGEGSQKPASPWHRNMRDVDSPSSPFLPMDLAEMSSVPPTGNVVEQPPQTRTEHQAVSPTLSASSRASRHQGEPEEQQQGPATPSAFGANILPRRGSAWSDLMPSFSSFSSLTRRSRSRSGGDSAVGDSSGDPSASKAG